MVHSREVHLVSEGPRSTLRSPRGPRLLLAEPRPSPPASDGREVGSFQAAHSPPATHWRQRMQSPLTSAPRTASRGISKTKRGGGADRARPVQQRLATYLDGGGRLREIVSRPAAGGTRLVVDRDAANPGAERLLAHLWADEPPENALLVCRHYLRDTRID